MGGSCFVQEPYTPETYTPNKLRLKELPELDNFHSCEIRFDDGQPWPSAEAWFQAQKFPDDPELQDKIRTSDGGVESFIEGRSGNNIRPDWEEVGPIVVIICIVPFVVRVGKRVGLVVGDQHRSSRGCHLGGRERGREREEGREGSAYNCHLGYGLEGGEHTHTRGESKRDRAG